MSANDVKPNARLRTYKAEALVLRASNLGEADRVVTFFSPTLGKFRATVRGARRITSRLGGHVDVLNRVQLAVAQGRTLDVVTNAEAQETFRQVKESLDLVVHALYLTELTEALVPELAPHPRSYNILLSSLRALGADVQSSTILRYSELRLLEDAGYMPQLSQCVNCEGNIMPNKHKFAPILGGVVCSKCFLSLGALHPLSVNALKVLRFFANSNLDRVQGLAIPKDLEAELERLLSAAISHVLEKDLTTGSFAALVRRITPESNE